jgi:hypothetical protein
MKRDMDLIRKILLYLEAETPVEKGGFYSIDFDSMAAALGSTFESLNYQLILLYEANLIDGAAYRGKGYPSGSDRLYENCSVISVSPRHLTWEGQEFLETVRDEEVWQNTKRAAKSIGSFGLDTLKELGKGFIKKKIKDHTGIDLDFGGSDA